MSYQYPNLAQSNGSPPPPPEDATLTAIHNAFLLGWSLMELKSRVQIAACNVALDSILIIQPQSADPPGCIGYLDHPFKKEVLWPAIVSLFLSVRGTQPSIQEGNRSCLQEKTRRYG